MSDVSKCGKIPESQLLFKILSERCDECRPPIKVYFDFPSKDKYFEYIISNDCKIYSCTYKHIFEIASKLINEPMNVLIIDGYEFNNIPQSLFCLDEFREPSRPFKVHIANI